MLIISELYIYPIKSLGGISLNTSAVTTRGLQYDRRWMLVDNNNRFLTQREFPAMALLQAELTNGGLTVHHKKHSSPALFIPHKQEPGNEIIKVQIWNDVCEAQMVSKEANNWFSKELKMPCRLVYMPDATRRMADKAYAANDEITSFSDDYPVLLIGQASLDELNTRLKEPLSMDRFRPNIVFTGGHAFEEDGMAAFEINGIEFFGVKLCARCMITTINQDNGVKRKEPLKTLATYRLKNNKVYFGQNLLHKGTGVISVGDTIDIKHKKAGFQPD